MPTIQRFGAAKLCIYADDHRPPHFHIVGPDFQVLVSIADLVVFEGAARSNQIAAAMAWAHANQNLLAQRWTELNERG